jgi:sarcosine oxidase delta subunit
MTGTYDWNPMPHVVSVRCPRCSARAAFEFAEHVRIARKAEVPFFQKSKLFDYVFVKGRWHGQDWHAAVFHAGLHGGIGAIKALPKGYAPEDWAHSKYFVRSQQTDRGTVVCAACGLRRKHRLAWPSDAWFQVEHRGKVLWAFDRSSANALRELIAATGARKKTRRDRWSSFLLHVPKEFLAASARDSLGKKLDRLLGEDLS